MFDKYFLVWSVIPMTLLLLTAWAVVKPVFSSTPAKEPLGFYLKQFIFTFVLLIISSLIIHSGLIARFQPLVNFVFPEGMLEWFVYPLTLLIAAYVIPVEKAPEDSRTRNSPANKKRKSSKK